MTNEFMTNYSTEAKKLADGFRKQYDALQAKAAKYGIDVRPDIDDLIDQLKNDQTALQERFQNDLQTAVTNAKHQALKSASITEVERKAVEPFISEVRLKMAIASPEATAAYLETYADTMTGPQRDHVLKTLVNDLATNGIDVRRIARSYANPDVKLAHETVESLQSLSTEDATLEITNLKRSHRAFTKPKAAPTGRTFESVQPLYESEES